ncbi:tail fiber domain-containing protein [Streptococcus pneumoniae]|nr:phage tail spike protein [Streptococcus pneumoniae]MDA2878765.1 tail fiber domain-containing protein [Streptococcus pneumoniae]MDG8938375.1 tail fiber domain-containing protein [Streptococcus pneumoniae]
MIYLTEGNTPLNEAYNDEIVHLGNNTYQLTFRFPTSDTKWELLKEETFLTADDLHGEQDFYIFEVEKQQGYIQVYANQVISLLNNYIVSSIEVDRVSGTRVLSAFAGSITRANPFSFFSDIDDRHTLNIKDKNAMEVLAKGKHSILGQWGGDMVRNGYNLRLLKNGGSENESLFMYKKNLSSYQHKTSTKSLKTRITFKTTVKGEGENAVDHDYMVVIDSPLLGNYSQIYEDVVEVNDQDVTDKASLIEYGKQYFRTSMCDMLEDNLEISVVGQSDVAVQMFDVVSFYHEWYGLDVRKKITKYTYSPMAKLLKSIGFGTFQSSLANAIGGIVNDAVLNESRNLHQIFEERLKKEIANADRAFDAEFSKREKTITDAIELAKAKAEEVKQELSDTINQRFNSFDNGPLKEAKRKAEEALRNAGASSSLAQESKRIGLDSVARLEAFKSQTTSAQTALSGDLDALKRTIVNDIRPKQAQVEAEIAKQVEALVQTKKELSGASTLLAQEAKRIELDSVARLEAFKSQTTSAQTALSGDLDVLKRTIANDIRPKQAQAEAEIAKQVEALVQTKKELSGASTLLAQEAKRIELDSVARLEAFKSQTTSAQTALSGDLDVLKRTIANDIRPKQAQAEAEIAKQVEVLSRTKNELAGVKSAQATYEETTTRRLSELTNLANGKASKSELTQTAEELASRIASVQAGSSRNYFRNSRSRTFTTGGQAVYDYRTFIVPDFWKNSDRFKRDYVRISFDVTFPVALVNDMPAMVHFSAHPWYAYRNLIFKGGTVERQHFEFTIDLSSSSEDYQTNNVFIRFGTNYGFPAGLQVVIENAMLSVGNYFPAYQPAYEDQEDRVSVVESNFKQRADSLEAGVSRLTEGLRTKADISSLNVTAENIRQSVKSLETDTQNKLNQKLSQAEFEVRAGSIRQEILNATKDKASKSELTQTAEELSSKIASVQASGRNLFLNSLFKQDISKTGIWTTSTYTAAIDSESKYLGHNALKIIGLNPSGRDGGNPKVTYPALGQFGKVIPGSTTNQDVTISFYAKANKNGIMLRSRLGNIGYKTGNVTLSTEIKRYVVHIPKGWTNESKQTTNEWLFNFNQEGTVWIWMPKFEISDVDTSYSEAPEDIEGQISTVESTFKQRANSLDAGVRSLTEGLRTKVDISALNVTAENIRQSVKSLETDTQNKLNQKLSQAEFEVRAGSIRQEILNATKDKASKSELTQTAEELASRIASVHLGRRNLLKGTKELARYKPVSEYNGFKVIRTVAGATRYQDSYVERTVIPTAGTEYIAIFYARASENDYPVRCHFYNPNTVVSSENSSGYKSRSSDGLSIIRLSTDWQLCWVKWTQTATDQAKTVIIGRHGPQVGGKEGVWVEICAPAIFEGNLAGDWSPAYEDQDERVSAVESNFKQRADSLEAGVSRLTEGLRTKADISSLNVTAENIRQSVKSLETDTQNKLNQKLSQAEFEVRAGSIRQEILNATKDKASKSELTQTAEELSSKIASVQVGGRNYIRGTKRMMLARGLWASGTFRPSGAGTAKTIDVSDSPATGFDKAIRLTSSNARDQIGIAQDGFYISQGTYTMSCWVKGRRGQKVKLQTYWQVNDNSGISPIFTLKDENWTKLSFTSARNRAGVASIGYVYLVNAEVGEYLDVLAPQLEDGSLATSSKEAPEDIEGQISTVESTFKQRADSLEAGVSRLTEGLRTKADISALNVTAENIRQSVKSLETDTQNKLNQKLSQAEFEVRAGSIRQEILNATKDKASKSELTQTAEELSSKIASVQASGRNLFLNSLFKQDISKTGIWTTSTYTATIDSESKYLGHKALKIIGLNPSGRDGGNPKVTYPALGQFGKVIPGSTTNQDVTISFYAKANKNGIMLRSRLGNIGYKTGNVTLSTEIKRYVVHIPKGWTNESKQTTNEWLFNFNQEGTVWIWMPKFEISDVDTSYSEAPEDIEGQISTVESTFKQRANSLDAGVSRLTEGLRTKVDISALNVTAENIRQSVKSLETDTQNKLNQKLSQAEFEVRAGSIRQEILNATKDKADKTLVVSEAGKLREEFSKMKVGGRNLWIKSKTVGAVIEKLPENHVTGQKECYRLENNSTLTFNLEPDFSSRLYQKVTFSAWIKYENVVQGRNFWNVFNCFKHYLFRKNSETGVQSGPDYATLGMYKGSADWKYITFTYDYSEKTNFDQLKTSLRFNLEGATSGTAWVTGIKVEIGSVATDWSPAPEDADGLITEAKATFERTAQGLRTDLSAIQEYVNKDGQRQEALQRYTREESTRQATAVRELVNRDFVGKATYQEDVKGINQRIEAVKTSANKDIASQIASYRQSVDGKFTDISSQITTYKQDVGGQISGLSNRLTSSEQGTTTQISNLSNRINSNKQGTDNQILNLKTQVATNKDNAERQMGRISDQVSANKANADSQFVNVTNQLARKVETTDFQRVKETSKLYERILGNTENGIADKVARMALTNQLFQVEVAKNASNGQNLLKGTKDFSGGWKNKGANWKKHAEKYKGVDVLFKNNSWNGVGQEIDAKIGEVYTFSLWMKSDWKNDTVNFYVNRNGSVEKGWGVPSETSVAITSEWKRYSFTFKITVDGFIFPRVERLNQNTNLYIAGLKLEKGSYATPYTEAPEDTDEAIRSVQSQLTGSWAVQNINSAGDIISGINLGANGHNRFVGKLTHITGETLIDRAVIKSAMVDKLKTANFEAGSVTTTILDAEAVTAEKLKVDNALIRKLTANDAFIDQLISKRIFSTKVESVISSSTFLEAYQGRIGGFTLGQFDQGGGRWISGVNQFSVGMGNGAGYGVRTAFWANWGNNWNYAGPKAWNVNTDGKMYCRNEVGFYDQVDFSNSSRANFYGNTTFSRSPVFSNGIELGSKDVLGDGWNPKGGRNAVVWWNQVGSGSVKYWMEQKSDRRLKENITDTAVKALDKINRLRMVAFDFIESKKHEEIGLIAQEAETIVPRIVSRDPENPDGYLHIDYTALVPYLIKAIQELNQKIEKMEKTIA